MKKVKISISDFSFRFVGCGHYSVTYQSPITLKCWSIRTNNTPLIDATKNSEAPKIKDLQQLKNLCKA